MFKSQSVPPGSEEISLEPHHLARGVCLRGRVLDELDLPAQGAAVWAERWLPAGGLDITRAWTDRYDCTRPSRPTAGLKHNRWANGMALSVDNPANHGNRVSRRGNDKVGKGTLSGSSGIEQARTGRNQAGAFDFGLVLMIGP